MDSSTKFNSFRQGLQMYKRKNKFTNALGLVVKRLVTCLEDTPVDDAKTVDLHTILDIFTSVFSQLVLPVQQANRLEYLVDSLISNKMVQEALLLTTAPYPVRYTVPFLELQMRVRHNQGNMEEFWKIFRDWEVNKLIAYAETTYILGIRLMDSGHEGNLQRSIDTFRKGITMAEEDGKQSLVERMRNMLSKAEERQLALQEDIQSAAQEAQLQQAMEEAERHEN